MSRDIKLKLVFKRCIRGTLWVREEEINAHRDAIPVSNKNGKYKVFVVNDNG